MEIISTAEAAERKGISRQAVVKAVNRGDINGQKVAAKTMVVVVDKTFESWEPMKVRQAAGRARWEKQDS